MPHQSLKLIPGVDQTKTPALNEAAISESQLVRFMPDRTLGGIVQKLGGWSKYITANMRSVVRALHAWADTNGNSFLAVGADGGPLVVITSIVGNGTTATVTFVGPIQFVVGYSVTIRGNSVSAFNGTFNIVTTTDTTLTFSSATAATGTGGTIAGSGDTLSVVQSGVVSDISPQDLTINIAPQFTTTLGSNEVVVTDVGRYATDYDVVDIRTQISVGGLILYGQYAISSSGAANTYSIYATDILGDPAFATAAVVLGGAVPSFQAFNGSAFVGVTLNDHGLVAGDTFPVRVTTVVGGIALYGNYIVTEVTSANVFTIAASNSATANATVSENGGNVNFVYHKSIGPQSSGSGYGIGYYGEGAYGSGSPPIVRGGVPINAEDWTLDNWGEVLISCPLGGTIYTYDPSSGDRTAKAIANSPPANRGAFVAMPQRQIIAWGSTQTGIIDPLLIRWCDVNDYDAWIATPINQAGSYRIPKGSKIVQCIQGPQQGLIWTDLGIWAMQYVGPPYVYQFNEIGTGCGLIGRKAAGSLNGTIYWMGQSQFYRLSGGGVEPIKCPIWDVIFQDIDKNNLDKIRIAPNSRFGEVAWHFPVAGGNGENVGYVKYNVLLDQWDYGFNSTQNPYVARSAWINESVLGPPIGAGLNYYIYQHEVSLNADDVPMNSWFQTGYFALTDADVKMFVDQVWPDMKWGLYGGVQSANVKLTFYSTDYAGTTPTAQGPFTMTKSTTYVTPRMRGRLVSIKIESDDPSSFWRVGNIRYRLQPDGRF